MPPLPPAPQEEEEGWEGEEDEDWDALSPYERERRRRAVAPQAAPVRIRPVAGGNAQNPRGLSSVRMRTAA